MKYLRAIPTTNELPSNGVDNVFPYARLSCSEISEKNLQKVATVYSLKLMPTSNPACIDLSGLQPKPGEHKIETITLMAAALLLHQKQPRAKLYLQLRRDFMNDVQPAKEDPALILKDMPTGCFKISQACQIFLTEAGFDLPITAGDLTITDEMQAVLIHFLSNQRALFKVARGA